MLDLGCLIFVLDVQMLNVDQDSLRLKVYFVWQEAQNTSNLRSHLWEDTREPGAVGSQDSSSIWVTQNMIQGKGKRNKKI